MVRNFAKIFGAVFLLIGVLGFVPALTPDNRLLGLFEVNGLHNIIHLASGAAALLAGFGSYGASKTYFKVFGVIYALVTLLGFVYGDRDILGLVAHNMADTWLHVAISAAALYLGFGYTEPDESPAADSR